MRKENLKYEEGKKKLSEIVSEMNNIYQYHKQMIEDYEVMGYPSGYDEEEGKLFVKTMEVINQLKPHEKNLWLCFVANNYNLKQTLEIFNDEGASAYGKKYKNEKSLRVLLFHIKRKIKETLL